MPQAAALVCTCYISCQITERPRGSTVWNRRHGSGNITCGVGKAWQQAPNHTILSPGARWKLPACVESHDCSDKQLHNQVTFRDRWLWTGRSFLWVSQMNQFNEDEAGGINISAAG